MEIYVNEKVHSVQKGVTAGDVRDGVKSGADLIIVNGYPCREDTVLREGDRVSLIKKGEIPGSEELEALMIARHTPGRELKAGVISFKNLGEGRQWFGLKLDARHQEEHLGSQALELFHEQLTLLLREVFDPQIPFRASEDRRVI